MEGGSHLLPYLWEYKARVVGARLPGDRQAGECRSAARDEGGRGQPRPEPADRCGAGRAARCLRVLRFSTTLFQELRDVVFVRVTQRMRRVALGVFRHLHSLSLRFHLERQTVA